MKFNNNKRYYDFASFIKEHFSERVQKISLDTGFTCPNRDGSKGIGGCTYCNNNSFNPNYCKPDKGVTQQLKEGISFFSKKYKSQKYLAYFQAYTNTYSNIEQLKKLYTEALSDPGVVGMVIGTRPDCIDSKVVDLLSELSKDHLILLEFGVESTLNRTLDLVNRCHTYEETIAAFDLAKDRGLILGAHMIIGLPGESKEDILNHAKEISKLPITTLKLHQLQIIKHTVMALQLKKEPEKFKLFTADEYIDLVTDFISLLRPDIVIERFISESPQNLLLAPKWNGLKNFEITSMIDKKLIEKDLWQGKFYN
jgi:radical SAM protein (TIGR01212 family)